jgi:hypothetical protein
MNGETQIRRGLAAIMQELRLLRALERADRYADPTSCPKSINQRQALRDLEEFREAKK